MPKRHNAVNHPAYYGKGPYEAIKIIAALGLLRGFCLGSAIKYTCRAGKKLGETELEALKKAKDCLDLYIDIVQKGAL